MNYLFLSKTQNSIYKICILVPEIRRDEIIKHYIEPYGLDPEEVMILSLHVTPGKKKTPAQEQKDYIHEMLQPVFNDYGIEYLIIGDGDYFKTFTKSPKVDAALGYVLDSVFGDQKTVYVPNFRTVFFNPEAVTMKIRQGITALKDHRTGSYQPPGIDIIQYVDYPDTVEGIRQWLVKLLDYSMLSCDLETFSLKHFDAGIGTITFCWSKTEGIAFPVDFLDEEERLQVRSMLKEFFEYYSGTMLYHNIAFDAYVLIYQLFMAHLTDQEGLLYGIDVVLRDFHDTKLISYLATNSCAGNHLSLKEQAQEYAGNYAVENIKDIRLIPLPKLLEYNVVDGISTWFVFEKHWQTLIDDNQLDIYENIFKPAIIDIIQMQLTGMPIDMERTLEVEAILTDDEEMALTTIHNSPIIQAYTYRLNEQWANKRNLTLKKKRVTVADGKEVFNPNSSLQLIDLLFVYLGLPVLGRTATKQPETGGDTLKALKNHTNNQDIIDLLNGLIDFKNVAKILTAFIPAMKGAQRCRDGWHWLFGNFNLGGTVSGRLSSSDPNLQNLPANGKYAKLIKSCFRAPPGWHFTGIDFASLEDRISGLTTKDPEKLKVYTDGYDGHSLRAYAYFGDQMPDIDPNSVESINSIEKKYKPLRQDSKPPTFALTYQGTYRTLMTNCGFTEELARKCEGAYQTLYQVSIQWVNDKLDQAARDGYVTVAFGLRVRTPLLEQVLRGVKTPREAEAEGRTAGNALGQSWCLLNSRAGSEFLGKARKSKFRNDIKPCAQIHDAQYYLIRDDIAAIMYANEHVVKACQWQDHPDIWHDEVKLGGEFSIFYPNWSKEFGIPNNASENEILISFTEYVQNLN